MAGLTNLTQLRAVVRQQQADRAAWQQNAATQPRQTSCGRDGEVLRAIKVYQLEKYGNTPSYKIIMRNTGISSRSVINKILRRLADNGAIEIVSGKGEPLQIILPGANFTLGNHYD